MKAVSILNSFFRLPTWRESPLSTCHCQTAHAQVVSILNSPFSDFSRESSLHSKFAILRAPLCWDLDYCATAQWHNGLNLNKSPCINCLHSKFAFPRMSSQRQSPFSTHLSQTSTWRYFLLSIRCHQTVSMKRVSILNSPFSDIPHEDSLHYHLAILWLPLWRLSPFSIRHSQTLTWR